MSKRNKCKPVIGLAEIKHAYRTLLAYKEGKRALEKRITENEEWFKLRCCSPKSPEEEIGQSSAWLFNSIINKHADAMDSFPEPNVLPWKRATRPTRNSFRPFCR